ncbi:MAG: hypothetical protein SVY41_00125 [Candidatus Nanohaloarchaea archaeon]|nr:hypothetical protein [Candidatus Nanohaloarchaea archaeon]
MRWLHRAVALAAVLCVLAGGAAAQARMNTTVDEVEVNLGQRMASSLVLYNPLDQPDIYDIGVGVVMNDGAATARIVGDDRTTDRVTVELGPNERRSVQVYYAGAACPSEACTGTATFVGRSLETDQRFTADTQVTVRRNTDVYGSPGLQWLQVLAVAAAAATLSLVLN